MKAIITLLIVFITAIMSSCGGGSSDNPSPNPPVQPDTLTTGWSKQSLGNAYGFVDIFFIGQTGFTTNGNTVFKSTDGGVSWSFLRYGTGTVNLGMGSSNNMAIANSNRIVSTQNGGASFDSTTVTDGFITDVFYINATTAYAVNQGIWKTTNGGTNWNKIYTFASSSSYSTLHFINEQTGWMMGNNGLFKTTNGGVNWQAVPLGPGYDLSYSCAVYFVNTSTGYISDRTSVAKTTDGGVTWNKIYTSPAPGAQAYLDIHFIDATTGYITDGQWIKKTTDGGGSWAKVVSLPSISLVELHFTDATHGWACGSNGTILRFAP